MAVWAAFRRRVAALAYAVRRCPCRCPARRGGKLKAEDATPEARGDGFDVELGAPPSPAAAPTLANSQDADERAGAPGAAEIPHWQMPQLIVECSQRPGARIHKGTSVILPDAGGDLIAGIVTNLPTLLQIKPCWQLGYSMAVDGVSLRTMYRQVGDTGPCLLIVEDSSNCIFGAFLSEGIRPGQRCYGTHECFVFRYPRAAGAWRTQVFGVVQSSKGPSSARVDEPHGEHWANYFEALRKCQAWANVATTSAGVFCDHLGIVVGLDGPALFIDQNLLRGVSWPSAAFGSPCLAATGPDFVVRNLEVWRWAAP